MIAGYFCGIENCYAFKVSTDGLVDFPGYIECQTWRDGQFCPQQNFNGRRLSGNLRQLGYFGPRHVGQNQVIATRGLGEALPHSGLTLDTLLTAATLTHSLRNNVGCYRSHSRATFRKWPTCPLVVQRLRPLFSTKNKSRRPSQLQEFRRSRTFLPRPA